MNNKKTQANNGYQPRGNGEQRGYQPRPNSGYQPTNSTSTPPAPPTSGSNAIKPNK